jgi:energy-converting hydrogenase Eha subunit C
VLVVVAVVLLEVCLAWVVSRPVCIIIIIMEEEEEEEEA